MDDLQFRIRAGSTYHHRNGFIHNVTTVVYHHEYNMSTFDYDISVIRVRPPLDIGSKSVNKIELATKNKPVAPGIKAVVAGWGVYYFLGIISVRPRQLIATKLPIVDKETCRRLVKVYPITDRMLCAGYMIGGKDSCKGDSGGALVARGVQVGIVSWGEYCGATMSPGVYADVGYLRKWISTTCGV